MGYTRYAHSVPEYGTSKMMKALDYLYVGLYRLLMRTNEKDIAEFSALTFLSVGLVIYLTLLTSFLGFDPRKYLSIRTYGLVFTLFVGLANYFRYLRSGRYKILYDELLKRPIQQQRTCSIVSVAFVAGGLALIIIVKILTT
jgi:hypothetical protein